ncbi:hypothetical protein [Luteococcus japonicus]|nr:hypothetical protein [Luteococcus japonicus]
MLSRGIFSGGGLCGIVGTDAAQWDTAGARAIGAAFVHLVGLSGQALVMGHDMRPTSADLARAVAEGALSQGADVVDLGLCSTDQLVYSSAVLEVPGVMITGGHLGAAVNGILLWQAGAVPVDEAFLDRLAARAEEFERSPRPKVGVLGSITADETLTDYATHLRAQVDADALAGLHVVVDAGNGMVALDAPAVLGEENLGLHLELLNRVLDGTFPQHGPNPSQPASLVQAAARVRTSGADLGLVFDGDGDRCAVLDEAGVLVPDDAVTQIVGGSRPGDLFGTHGGMLTALRLMECLGISGEPLSALVSRCAHSATSGEINLAVGDADAALRAVGEAFEHHRVQSDCGDGLTLSGEAGARGEWSASLRPDDGQGLRLVVEAADRAVMEAVRDDLCSILAAVA